jgi:putative DNA primase/helicase
VSVELAIGIPEELKERRRWVTWCLEERAGEQTKVPYAPHRDRKKARSTDPGTWADYPDAIEAYGQRGHDGIGFVFSPEDRITGIDLDHCRDPETGGLEPWAEEIVRELDSYSEISPSGKGVHIIVHGKLPPGGNRKGKVEMYDHGRFFTMTGRRLPDTPSTVNERQSELRQLHRRLFAAPKADEAPTDSSRPGGFTGDDQELVERAMQAANGEKFRRLWDGDTEGYDSASEADLALVSHLAFWTGGERERIDRLFRESGLYRDKWERADYRERTIRAALAHAEFYRPAGSETYARPTVEEEPASGAGEDPPSANGRGGSPGEDAPAFNLTDLGNAERLIANHGENLRYCHPWRTWLVWTGKRWAKDDTGWVHRLAKQTVRRIYREAAAATDEEGRKALAKHAARSESGARIKELVDLARSDVPVKPNELDTDPWLLNVANGTIDLRTGELRPHRREDLITRLIPVEYDPAAAAPAWKAFLEGVLLTDRLRRFLQRAAGYSVVGDTRERVLLILHGSGRNGKSTLLEALHEALGNEEGYAMKTPTETLMEKRPGVIPNDVARLKGARFVFASETQAGRKLAESLVKEITGNNTLTARFMRGEYFEFKPTHQVWLETNHKPVIQGTDHAIWDRIKLVPFEVRIPDAEIDQDLPDKLRAELPGILAWVVEGCLSWQREGLGEPEEVRAATEGYRVEMDVLAAFIEDRCVVATNAEAKATPLYNAYKEWAEFSSEKAETQRGFGMRLTERGFVREKRGGIYRWLGIGLLADDSGSEGPGPGPSPDDGPGGQSPANKGETAQELARPGPLGPESRISSMNSSHVETNRDPGPNGPNGPGDNPEVSSKKVDATRATPATTAAVEELLQKPPEWLWRQAQKHLQDPAEETLKALCASVAHEALDNPRRGGEVQAAVERWLGNLGAGDEDLEGLRDLIEEDQ